MLNFMEPPTSLAAAAGGGVPSDNSKKFKKINSNKTLVLCKVDKKREEDSVALCNAAVNGE